MPYIDPNILRMYQVGWISAGTLLEMCGIDPEELNAFVSELETAPPARSLWDYLSTDDS